MQLITSWYYWITEDLVLEIKEEIKTKQFASWIGLKVRYHFYCFDRLIRDLTRRLPLNEGFFTFKTFSLIKSTGEVHVEIVA